MSISETDLATRPIRILLVEDNPGDIRLTEEALKEGRIRNHLTVARTGIEALQMLRREGIYANTERTDLILLDLNLPQKDGREVLAEIKSDETLRRVPVVVLTTSSSEADILKSYDLHANCYITKPMQFQSFIDIIHSIEAFWLTVVKLPRT
jgi:chemotaxis family two-component system response regulator Rcp1